MLIEHLFYSAGIAIVVGMIYNHFTGKDPSWIIVISAFAPDIDLILNPLLGMIGVAVVYHGNPISHGDLHNLAVLAVFAVVIAFLVYPLGISFIHSLLMGGIGFGAHLFEDALVYSSSYTFYWPISSVKAGFGILPESHNFLHIANIETMIVGIFLVILAIGIRIGYEGTEWLNIGDRI